MRRLSNIEQCDGGCTTDSEKETPRGVPRPTGELQATRPGRSDEINTPATRASDQTRAVHERVLYVATCHLANRLTRSCRCSYVGPDLGILQVTLKCA